MVVSLGRRRLGFLALGRFSQSLPQRARQADPRLRRAGGPPGGIVRAGRDARAMVAAGLGRPAGQADHHRFESRCVQQDRREQNQGGADRGWHQADPRSLRAFLLRFNDDERAAMSKDPKMAQMMFERRKSEMAQGQLMIALRPANSDRVAGWSYLHEMLRFRAIMTETEDELKQRLGRLYQESGVEAHERELAKSHLIGPE